jgi:polyferredoxin
MRADVHAKWEPKRMRRRPLFIVLLVLLVLLVLGALPTWPYSMGWGYYPSGGLGLVLLIVLLLVLFDRL